MSCRLFAAQSQSRRENPHQLIRRGNKSDSRRSARAAEALVGIVSHRWIPNSRGRFGPLRVAVKAAAASDAELVGGAGLGGIGAERAGGLFPRVAEQIVKAWLVARDDLAQIGLHIGGDGTGAVFGKAGVVARERIWKHQALIRGACQPKRGELPLGFRREPSAHPGAERFGLGLRHAGDGMLFFAIDAKRADPASASECASDGLSAGFRIDASTVFFDGNFALVEEIGCGYGAQKARLVVEPVGQVCAHVKRAGLANLDLAALGTGIDEHVGTSACCALLSNAEVAFGTAFVIDTGLTRQIWIKAASADKQQHSKSFLHGFPSAARGAASLLIRRCFNHHIEDQIVPPASSAPPITSREIAARFIATPRS